MNSHPNQEGHSHDVNVKKVDRLSATRVRLTVEFSGEAVAAHEKVTAKRYLQQAKIPGFRPGKAPIKMVTDKYKEDILKDVIQHLVEAGFAEAVEKEKLSPVNRPRMQVGTRQLGDPSPFEFSAEFDVHPEIELRSYKGMPLKAEPTDVKDEEVQKTIDNIRERMASLEPVDAKTPEKGNFAVVEVAYHLKEEGAAKEPARNFTVELGAGRLLPELEKSLLEMTVGGEMQTVEAKFPDDYEDKKLAGKDAIFEARILELKKKTLPEMNDELAAQIKPGATVEVLQNEIRESIVSSKQEENRKSQRNQVVEYLIANNTFEVPQSMVERQMASLLQWMAEDMQKRGQKMSPLKEEDITEVKKRAEQMVRSSMLLKEVAEKENLALDEAKVQERLQAIASQVDKSLEETEKLLEAKGMLDQIRNEVLTDQVFDFLIGNAQRVDSAPRP